MKSLLVIFLISVLASLGSYSNENQRIRWDLLWLDSSNSKVASSLHFYNAHKENAEIKRIMLESIYIECFKSWVIQKLNLPIEDHRRAKYPHEYIKYRKLSHGVDLGDAFYNDPLQALPRGGGFDLPLGEGNFTAIFTNKMRYLAYAKEFRKFISNKK